MTGDALKLDYVGKYNSVGEQRFYKFLLNNAITKLIKIRDGEFKGCNSPELEFLDYAEKFLILYRRDNEEIYLSISRTLRKAAHKIYRICLKNGYTQRNSKFLNLVN